MGREPLRNALNCNQDNVGFPGGEGTTTGDGEIITPQREEKQSLRMTEVWTPDRRREEKNYHRASRMTAVWTPTGRQETEGGSLICKLLGICH